MNNLALDPLGAAWITGQTYSSNFRVSSNAVQPAGSSTVATSGDAFLYKLQTNGNSCDVAVTIGASTGTVAVGVPFTYTITVTNNNTSPPNAAERQAL